MGFMSERCEMLESTATSGIIESKRSLDSIKGSVCSRSGGNGSFALITDSSLPTADCNGMIESSWFIKKVASPNRVPDTLTPKNYAISPKNAVYARGAERAGIYSLRVIPICQQQIALKNKE